MIYTISQIANIRGYQALTQGKKRLQDKLLYNINSIGGKKAIGFKSTRVEVLTEEFDHEALQEMVEVSMELEVKIGDAKEDPYVARVVKNLLERIFRDHVPMDMVREFRLNLVQRIKLNGNDIALTMKQIEDYFTCGRVCSVAESFREACKELEEGRIMHYVPR